MTLKDTVKNIHEDFMSGDLLIFAHPLDVEMETLVTKELSRMIDDMQESNTINIGEALRRMYRAGMSTQPDGVIAIATTK